MKTIITASRRVQLSKFLCLLPLLAGLAGCSIDDKPEPIETGLQTIQSGGVEREFYVQLPEDAAVLVATAVEDGPPLVFAFHGYTGSYTNWVGEGRFYDLLDVVGDEAVFVAPQALLDASGNSVWGGQPDLDFFIDMINELERRGVEFDRNRIFVTGHSNGAGFSHDLGCEYGDVIRGIAVAAGSLIRNDCVGAMGVLMMQGSNDPLTSPFLAEGALGYWVLYNGWDADQFVPAEVGPCDDYSFPGEDNSPYPVIYCEHTQGHGWPDFGSQTAWDFLTGLADVEPSLDEPAGGGAERATPPSDATLVFQVDAPAEMARPLRAAATLRDPDFIQNPTCSAPDVIMGIYPVDSIVIPGQVSEVIEFDFTYLDFSGALEFPSDWALSLTIYVEGGSNATIPAPGVDYDAAIPINVVDRNLDLIIDEPIPLVPVQDLCGFGS